MKNRLIMLAALILLGLNSPVWAASTLDQVKKNGLRVCMEPAYMPFEIINKQGKIIGFDPDLATMIAQELRTELKLVKTAWNDLIPALIANKCDMIMSGMTITKERSQKIDFTNSYIVIGQTVLLRKALADKVTSYKDLNDPQYKVVSKRGTTCEAAAKDNMPKAQYISFDTEQEGLMEVINGKADAFVYDSPFNAIAFAQNGQDKLVFLDSPFTFEALGWGIRKNDPQFKNWLNDFLSKIKRNGTSYTLYKKWFKNMDWLKGV